MTRISKGPVERKKPPKNPKYGDFPYDEDF
jgi:hypothetical protein